MLLHNFRTRLAAEMRYIDNDIRDFQAPAPGKKERRTSKVKKADAVENDRVHAALRLSLQRILRENPPQEGAKSRDFSIYTGQCSADTHEALDTRAALLGRKGIVCCESLRASLLFWMRGILKIMRAWGSCCSFAA